VITSLRTLDSGKTPVFLSESGIGSAVDVWRAVRHFEQAGAAELEDARFFRDKLDRFLADYDSGLMLAVYRLGAGRFVVNTLRIRENLGTHPVAERLLRNLLRYAAADSTGPLVEPPRAVDALLRSIGYAVP